MQERARVECAFSHSSRVVYVCVCVCVCVCVRACVRGARACGACVRERARERARKRARKRERERERERERAPGFATGRGEVCTWPGSTIHYVSTGHHALRQCPVPDIACTANSNTRNRIP
eukprot:1603802-Rhodomonas_salina.1